MSELTKAELHAIYRIGLVSARNSAAVDEAMSEGDATGLSVEQTASLAEDLAKRTPRPDEPLNEAPSRAGYAGPAFRTPGIAAASCVRETPWRPCDYKEWVQALDARDAARAKPTRTFEEDMAILRYDRAMALPDFDPSALRGAPVAPIFPMPRRHRV